MTDLEKPIETPRSKAARSKKKPPTQTAGVSGIDGHGAMGGKPTDTVESNMPVVPAIDWHKLVSLPAFEMFVFEQSGFTAYPALSEWVENRREALGDDKLYKLYADWHSDKGYWINETPDGKVIEDN